MSGSKAGRQSARHATKYKLQKNRTTKNKRNKLKRHLKKHPNDLQAKEKLKRI